LARSTVAVATSVAHTSATARAADQPAAASTVTTAATHRRTGGRGRATCAVVGHVEAAEALSRGQAAAGSLSEVAVEQVGHVGHGVVGPLAPLHRAHNGAGAAAPLRVQHVASHASHVAPLKQAAVHACSVLCATGLERIEHASESVLERSVGQSTTVLVHHVRVPAAHAAVVAHRSRTQHCASLVQTRVAIGGGGARGVAETLRAHASNAVTDVGTVSVVAAWLVLVLVHWKTSARAQEVVVALGQGVVASVVAVAREVVHAELTLIGGSVGVRYGNTRVALLTLQELDTRGGVEPLLASRIGYDLECGMDFCSQTIGEGCEKKKHLKHFNFLLKRGL